MANGIERVQDGWDLREVCGVGVTEVVLGRQLRLHIGGCGIEVDGPAELTRGEESWPVHAAERVNLDKVALLLGLTVTQVRAHDTGALTVRFGPQWRLDVPVTAPGLDWIVALRGRQYVSSARGGGVRMSDRRGAE